MAKREVVAKVANAVLYSDGLIRLDNARLSYPHLDKAWAGDEDQTPKFGAVALLDKTTHKAAKDLCVRRINEILKENKVEKLGADKKFIKDGDLTDKDEAQGMWVVSARESRRPACRGADGVTLATDEITDVLYAGCYVSILIRPWWQDHKKFGKRVNAGLSAVRFMRDGEPFGEGRIGDEDLDDIYDDMDDGVGGGGAEDDDAL